jgi:hypothetical protein
MNNTLLGIVDFCSYEESVPALMGLLGAARIRAEKQIICTAQLVSIRLDGHA